jgi:arylsulfatase A
MKFPVVLATFLAAGLLQAAPQPNILIIYGDDLGFGDLGCYNADSKIRTPHLDKLATESIRFTDGHSSSGICTPSRYALLTGRHHWRDFHGIVGPLGGSVFKPERLTLPEMLKEKGYATAAIGKWHLGWDWDAIRKPQATEAGAGKGKKKSIRPEAFDWTKAIPGGPLAHGFDHYFGDTVINFPPYCWIEDDKVTKAPDVLMDTSKWKTIKEGRWECRPGPMVSDWDPYQNIPTTTAKGVDFIKAQAKTKEPFFLYFAFPAPHAPIIPNDQFDGKSQAGPYGDFVHETDDAIGQLLAALKESGQAENTIVIFSADNGPEKYAYERDQKYDHWSAFPLRGLKRDIYEGGHHVPFLIRYPGVAQPGVSEALVSQIDLMATLAAAVGYELPDKNAAEDSHNLLPILTGEAKSVRETHVHNTSANRYAIRHGDWVLIDTKTGYVSGRNKAWETKHKYSADDQGPVELYNLRVDLGQRDNVAAKHPERVKELQALLAKIREQGYSAPRLP